MSFKLNILHVKHPTGRTEDANAIAVPSGGSGGEGGGGEAYIPVPGPQGPEGPAGKTPVKGVDYFTEEDVQEMVQMVYNRLLRFNGEVV